MFTVYILRTTSGTLYTGQTNNLEKRLSEHFSQGKRAAKYTKSFKVSKLVYTEQFETRGEALRREAAIKRLTKTEKEALIGK